MPTSALAVALVGTDPTQYAIVSDTCSNAVIAPLVGSCTVDIAFSPTATGNKMAVVQVSNGGMVAIASVTGKGTIPTPVLAVAPASHDFGSVGAGGPPSAPFQLTISNTGTALATSLALSLSSSEFVQTATTCGTSLAVGASCTADVEFAPTTYGPKTATLDASAANAAIASAALSGSGISDGGGFIAANPSNNDFGAIAVGQSASFAFTVVNNGALVTGPISLAPAGMNPTEFAIGTDTCTGAQLANGQTCTFAVVFSPTSVGTKNASVTATATHGGLTGVAVTGAGT